MKFEISVLAKSSVIEKEWILQIEKSLGRSEDLKLFSAHETPDYKSIVFIDGMMEGLSDAVSKIDRRGRYLVLMVREIGAVPFLFTQGRVDDLIVTPFRTLELLSKLRAYEVTHLLHEVSKMSDSFSGLVSKLREELDVASRLQKRKLPVRFPDVRGMKIHHRYLSGLKSGGDHFDLVDSPELNQTSVFLSDSSSYGLSSAILGSLMRLTLKVSSQNTEFKSASDVVRRIYSDLQEQLGPKDELSLFFGVINRKEWVLNYCMLGECALFYAPNDQEFKFHSKTGNALRSDSAIQELKVENLRLNPQDRIVLVSDGFCEVAGGAPALNQVLNSFRNADAKDLLNELGFLVKRKFTDREDMADQDCSALVFDVDSKVLRLHT